MSHNVKILTQEKNDKKIHQKYYPFFLNRSFYISEMLSGSKTSKQIEEMVLHPELIELQLYAINFTDIN